jgi:hypothetical protein
MYVIENTITTLEQFHDETPARRALRRALFGGDAYIKRRAASERLFFSKEAAKVVFAISQRRWNAKSPRTDNRLETLTTDLTALREKALARINWRNTGHALYSVHTKF